MATASGGIKAAFYLYFSFSMISKLYISYIAYSNLYGHGSLEELRNPTYFTQQ